MSRTLHFGRDVLNAPDVDLEDLLSSLSASEVQSLLDEMASDPDDKHLPASVRTAYKCEKKATGPLNRDHLINHINEEGIKSPEVEELVPFELGKKRGKVYVAEYSEEELAQMERKKEIEEVTRLDDDEEAALADATTEDLMTLADIVGSNPQEFIMEAYADPLKYYAPDPPNDIDAEEVIRSVIENDADTKDVNLNNLPGGLSEEKLCDLFEAMRTNEHLVRLSAVNCDVNDFAVATLALALEQNTSLRSLNLESNRISPDSLAALFEALAKGANGVVEVRVSNQAQTRMGYRVESAIAEAVKRNSSLLKVGMSFEFPEVLDKVHASLIRNIDRVRKERVRNQGAAKSNEWKPARTIDE